MHENLVTKLKERDNLGELDVDERIILQWILNKLIVSLWDVFIEVIR